MNIIRKDTPAPFARKTQSPPQTPRRSSKRVSRTQKIPREVYLDSHTESNARANDERDERISHDLSLTANTGRNSVMENMLVSLNPDQPKLESPPRSLGSRFKSAGSPRSRGHAQSSSLNSDYSFPSPPNASRPSPHLPRGRRSNSSNSQSLTRIDSSQTDEEIPGSKRTKAYQSQRAAGAGKGSEPSSRGGRKSNKSSGSSSVDFGQMMRQPVIGRRSASFDNGRTRPAFSVTGSVSQPALYDHLEAAPTPTVPSGPRSPTVLPRAPPQSSANPKNSNKVFRSQPRRNKDDQSKELHPGTNKTRDSQRMPIPSFLTVRSGSPLQNPDPPMAPLQRRLSAPKDQTKDRPGFFRRVFGSTRSSSLNQNDQQPLRSFSTQDNGRMESRAGNMFRNKVLRSGAGDSQSNASKENQPPLLAKKPSSFFRRRKKSVSEGGPPPVLVPNLETDQRPPKSDVLADQKARKSPSISSLREFMNPYLSSGLGSGQGSSAGKHDTKHYPTKVAPKEATVKAVHSQEDTISVGDSRMAQVDGNVGIDFSKTAVPRHGSDAKLDDKLLQTGNQTFLHDSSSQETRLNDADSTSNRLMEPNVLEPSSKATSSTEDVNPASKKAPAPSTDDSIRTTQPAADFVKATKTSSSKSNRLARSRTASSDASRAREAIGQLAPTRSHSPKVFPDDMTPRTLLRPENSEENLRKLAKSPDPTEGLQSPMSPTSDYHSAFSRQQAVDTTPANTAPQTPVEPVIRTASSEFDATEPFQDDRLLAKRIYDGDETVVSKVKAAAWLGEAGPERTRVRRAYMELFEWQNLNILTALRDFCGRLLLKGETQQVDRILDAFSSRWCACNPNHGFKATDVVHTICYSILLLNTDLHVAEIEQKMTRPQFIKNTVPTIRRVATDAAPDAFESKRASTLPSTNWAESPSRRGTSPSFHRSSSEGRRSYDGQRPSYRLTSRPSDQATNVISQSPSRTDPDAPTDDSGPLVNAPFHGKIGAWEAQIEIVLREFYSSIRQQRLPLHRTENQEAVEPPPPASSSLSVVASNMLRRTPSMLSKAGSENIISRGRSSEPRFGSGRWTSKTRSRPRLYPTSTGASSRTSFDDQSSTWTPSASSTWSKYSLGKTQTSMSVNSYASSFPQGDYQQSIGFANALSQAIIREEGAEPIEETLKAAPLLEDESLELAGAPWAKEGMLKHKHHLEAVDKKAKDRNWVESFAVIEKGYMRLFSFHMNAKSLRQKAKNLKASGGVVGGGNWMDSAEDLDKFLLRQTIASALPPPGYSKTRPHVWALSLPNGALHLFQAGTPEIVKEFVSTANYWSARLSKEPLVGGISNVEYGWSDAVINSAVLPLNNENRPPSTTGSTAAPPRPSLQSSIRSSIDQSISGGSSSFRPKLPGDKISIADWSPPAQSMVASVLLEVDQLKALIAYVKSIESELSRHNELRSAMLLAFSPRGHNVGKAMANWERKSSYLLREIVKFRTYIDCLNMAAQQREAVHASRREEDGGKEGGEETGETKTERKEEAPADRPADANGLGEAMAGNQIVVTS
ncbi:MAG: hypothetical protein Q9167_004322 [Letrouitia subvulpina]